MRSLRLKSSRSDRELPLVLWKRLHGAVDIAGDPLSVVILEDGWSADVTFKGMSAGGSYDFGLGTNNDITSGAPKMVLSVSSPGYTNGQADTKTRTIYGTKYVRLPYPDNASTDETEADGNMTVRVSLSEYVYSGCTVSSVTFLAGLYDDGVITSNAKIVTATNNSTAAYQKPAANWSWVPYDRMTASTKLRAVAFHRHGVDCVTFSVTDGSTTLSETVSTPSIDATMPDETPVIEYITTDDLVTGFTQDTILTRNFVVYPLIGDSSAVLDSTNGTSGVTPLYGPTTGICDINGTYCNSVAVVDPVSGNDGTGAVATDAATAAANPYLTIAAAFNALRSYNNTNFGRNNCGGSIIYLRTGTHTWVNGSVTLGTTPDTWLTVTRYPTDAKSGVIIGNKATGSSLGLKLRLYDVSFTGTDATGTIHAGAGSALHVDQVDINSPSGVPFYVNQSWYTTHCSITALNGGLRANSTQNAATSLIRGNLLHTNYTGNIFIYTCVGNKKTSLAASSLIGTIASSTLPVSEQPIVAFNEWYGMDVGSAAAYNMSHAGTFATAIVQNVWENYANTTSQALLACAADGSTGSTAYNNVLLWNNTFAGQRQNLAYNDAGADAPERKYWSVKNNIFYDDNIKTDTFNSTIAPTGPNGARVNNWSQLYCVGWSGNLLLDGGNGFDHEFVGLSTLFHNWSGSTQSAYVKFTNYAAAIPGTSAGAGNGDYTLQVDSPARSLQRDLLLAYDIAGNARAATDAAGAYAQ